MQHQTSIILAGIIATAWIIPMAAIGDQNGGHAQSKAAAVSSSRSSDMTSYLHEDHAESPTARFEALDQDGDHRLQWHEAEGGALDHVTFEKVDADGSGDLDEREFAGVVN